MRCRGVELWTPLLLLWWVTTPSLTTRAVAHPRRAVSYQGDGLGLLHQTEN
jgi:hypothetical protein